MHALDLRHLPPPEPMNRILDALLSLPADARLDALTPQAPGPLLPILDEWGYIWRVAEQQDGSARIAICRRDAAAALLADRPDR